MLIWNPEIRYYTSRGVVVPDASSIFTLGYFLLLGGLAINYVGSVVLASFDYKRLARSGVARPFHWAWAFLGGLPYVIGRTVTVSKVAPRRGLWPIGVIGAGWVLYYVVAYTKGMALMQSMYSQMGY